MPAPTYPPGLGGLSEADAAALVTRTAAGDRAAWGQLYEHGRAAVERYLAPRMTVQADVADVAQEVFAQLPAKAGEFDPARHSVGAWLCGRVASYALAGYGHQRWRRMTVQEHARQAAQLPAPESAAQRESRPLSARLAAAVAGLSPAQRRAIELRHLEQRLPADAAAEAGITTRVLQRTEARACGRLRAQLADLEPAPVSPWVGLPKREAVRAAIAALGQDASAPTIVAWLRQWGVSVSRSCVHDTRHEAAGTPPHEAPTPEPTLAAPVGLPEQRRHEVELGEQMARTDTALRAADAAIARIDAARENERAAQAQRAEQTARWAADTDGTAAGDELVMAR